MYTISCDGYTLYDPRDESLTVTNPVCKLEVNTVGTAAFNILPNHPYYGKMQKMKSVFEIQQDGTPIFRGRMLGSKANFNNVVSVDLEGVMSYFNDSVIEPFVFPDDFLGDDGYNAAAESGNVIAFFLNWIVDQHNSQVQDFQKFTVGNVTVTDPNNYISRSNEDYASTWDTLKSKLFGSSIGGYLCIRYDGDTNYIDYVSDFELTNTQRITFGENLLDLTNAFDASETCSAILPLGATLEDENGNEYQLTIESIADGDLSDGIVKVGKIIYSKSAVESYGFICVPVSDSIWDDVTDVNNLKNKAIEYLTGTRTKLANTVTIKAVDLHLTDDEIQAFRIYRKVLVNSALHGMETKSYRLTKLHIDMEKPQNSTITLGETVLSLSERTDKQIAAEATRLEKVIKEENRKTTESLQESITTLETNLTVNTEGIVAEAMKSYVEKTEFDSYKSESSSKIDANAEEITFNFQKTTESITNVDGDLQAKWEQLTKYIRFSTDGIRIGSDDDGLMLTLDSGMICFKKNNVPVGWWDGTNFYSGNIVVQLNERAQFGNFAFVPRSDGSMMLLKVQ